MDVCHGCSRREDTGSRQESLDLPAKTSDFLVRSGFDGGESLCCWCVQDGRLHYCVHWRRGRPLQPLKPRGHWKPVLGCAGPNPTVPTVPTAGTRWLTTQPSFKPRRVDKTADHLTFRHTHTHTQHTPTLFAPWCSASRSTFDSAFFSCPCPCHCHFPLFQQPSLRPLSDTLSKALRPLTATGDQL
jgi:hypothetical protein